MDHLKEEVGVREDTELNEANLQELVKRFKALIHDAPEGIPAQAIEQLKARWARVQQLDERPGDHLSRKYKIPASGDSRQRAEHGVRQHGR